MDFLAVPDDLTTSNMHYTMSALDLDLTSNRLENAGTSAGEVSSVRRVLSWAACWCGCSGRQGRERRAAQAAG